MLNPHLFQSPRQQDKEYVYDDGDRGPAEFFHGREDIRARFQGVLSTAHAKKAGTTFLVQGAPGAGKSALLHQMCKESDRWAVARIGTQALWDPAAMTQALGKSYTVRRNLSGGVDAKVIHGDAAKEVAGDASAGEVLCHLAPYGGMILVLDEAQKLRKILTQNAEAATDTLDAIHNGELGKPVILAAAGLGTTKGILKNLDISRFKRGCVHQIEALGPQAEQAVIHDWLTIAGGAKGDVVPWIDAIAEKSHGWPQHVICYALCAKDVLKQTEGEMSSAALDEVFALGDQDRAAYYEGRVEGMPAEDIKIVAQVFSTKSVGDAIYKKEWIDALRAVQSDKVAEEMFNDLLHRGVIAQTSGGLYQSPIPSFHRWIVQNFGKDLGKGSRWGLERER